MEESPQIVYRLIGQKFTHDDNVFRPFYSSRSDELWSNQYLEELRGKYGKRGNKTKRLLDLLDVGTGSGIIAIHWLKLMPDDIKSVTMTDNNEHAIELAKLNIDSFFPDEQVTWTTTQRKTRYKGKICRKDEGENPREIDILIEKTENNTVWPVNDKDYDYIVFNGPHLNKDPDAKDKKTFDFGQISGIFDPDLRANYNFIDHLCERLKPKGFALLTFSDYSLAANDGRDSIEELLQRARSKDLAATFLSVSEFCPGRTLALLDDIKDIPKRKIMLWENVVFRRLKTPKASEQPKKKFNLHKTASGFILWKNGVFRRTKNPKASEQPKKKFNLHKIASGFIAAASQIADIYCTKEPITKELYEEMANRMQAFYRMFCDQVGWADGFENHFVLSGFSLPEVPEAYSWAYGENIYEHKKEIEGPIQLVKNDDSSISYRANQRQTKLQDTDIHRLEVWANVSSSQPESSQPVGYIDKNIAMNEAVSQLTIGKDVNRGIDGSRLQVRYRIQLPSIESSDNKSDYLDVISQLKEEDQFLKQILKDVLEKFHVEFKLPNNQTSYGPTSLIYCLFSRYSGSANKSAVFSLFSSTEDLPFLPLLRSFGRIANTAANNMLTSRIAYEAASKAARAAVFARNFSHITGSHVISNPQFRHSLVGDDCIGEFQKILIRIYDRFIAAENNFLKRYLDNPAQAMKLWSDETKILAETRDKVTTGDAMLENTRLFHEYLQGRFDFIARAIDDTKDQPEPVRFVKDLLDGFLLQTAYLDNLVADVGLRLDNMEFRVQIKPNVNEPFKSFKAKLRPPISGVPFPSARAQGNDIDWEYCSGTNESIMNNYTTDDVDVLVGLPGGLIAAHAFYSLLENIIRNSAKYGIGNQNKQQMESQQRQGMKNVYCLTVSLERTADSTDPGKPYYLVRIYDNYSLAVDPLDPKKKPWIDLQEKLENGFLKDNGEPQTEGLGMLEMQACAQLLCNSNESVYPGVRPDHDSAKAPEIAKTINLWTTEFYPDKLTTDKPQLAYNLTLNMPLLLGCLTDLVCSSATGLVFCSSDFKKMSDRPPFLLIIDEKWLKSGNRLELLVKERESLPYRILIVSQDGAEFYGGEHETRQYQRLRGAKQISNTQLLNQMKSANRESEEKEVILSAYREWLRAWKKPPDGQQWHLWIGLERQTKQVEQEWRHADEFFSEKTDILRLMVHSYSAGERGFATKSIQQVYKPFDTKSKDSKASVVSPAQQYWNAERNMDRNSKKALLFDNHGNCFPEAYEVEKATTLERSTRFYQKLSGAVSPDLFRMLIRPPKEEFMFRFFIYSLLEASLTDVGVVDERLAWSLVEGAGSDHANDRFAEDLLEHQKAGIFPVFRFRHDGAKEEVGHYTLVHKERLEKSMKLGRDNQVDQKSNVLSGEGITFAKNGQSGSEINLITPCATSGDGELFEFLEFNPDVILIHEGAMDILTAQRVQWVDQSDKPNYKKQLQALYELAPMIIRTSGRGRKSSWLGEHLPFIEFGQVSSGLLTARNKFSLVRGLLGSVGRKLELD
jgi:methylase of polypeptide subunit release factors